MPLVTGDLIELKIFSQVGPQIGLNVRHYTVGAWPVGPTDQIVADAICLKLFPLYTPLLAPLATFFGVAIYKIVGLDHIPFASSRAGTGNGSATGDVLPAQVSGLITLRTALPGRANRGRVFIPFPAEGANDAVTFPKPNAGYLTALANLAVNFQQMVLTPLQLPPTGGTLQGVILHRTGLPTTEPITAYVARPNWATQRRRGGFGPLNADPF